MAWAFASTWRKGKHGLQLLGSVIMQWNAEKPYCLRKSYYSNKRELLKHVSRLCTGENRTEHICTSVLFICFWNEATLMSTTSASLQLNSMTKIIPGEHYWPGTLLHKFLALQCALDIGQSHHTTVTCSSSGWCHQCPCRSIIYALKLYHLFTRRS